MTDSGNVFDSIPPSLDDEQVAALLSLPGVVVERIVSTGQTSPEGFWYDQAFAEWVLVLRGAASVLLEGEAAPREMKVGDYIFIPPHRRHRVTWTDPERPTVWLAIHIGDGVSRVPGSDGPLSSTVLPSGSEM